MKKIVEYDAVCTACGGTGLYVGFAEHDGAAVVCHGCKGSGCSHVRQEYEPFVERQSRKGVKRVFLSNPGVGIGVEKGVCILEDFGGLSFEDWEAGKPFPKGSEMRKYICPAHWYQGVEYKKKPHWEECVCGGTFYSCSSFKNKAKCWARWDKEFGGKS